MEALRAAAKQDRIAGFERDRGGIRADIRAALIDHPQHANRLGDAADDEAVRARPFR